jgi:hypothetical protein
MLFTAVLALGVLCLAAGVLGLWAVVAELRQLRSVLAGALEKRESL